MPKPLQDLNGRVFGRLTVTAFSHTRAGARRPVRYWDCVCSCGASTKVSHHDLLFDKITSCGCSHVRHGHARGRIKTREYQTWRAMISRCTDPNVPAYPNYGGRGIKVCERWRNSFPAFLEDMGPKPLRVDIDRINNDGNYEPENCRWTTRSENIRNSRPRKRQPNGQWANGGVSGVARSIADAIAIVEGG